MRRFAGALGQCRGLRERTAGFAATAANTYDFVVVGGGAAGAVVAARLSEDPGAKVLLLEAGPKPPPDASVPVACGGLQQTAVDWARRGPGGGIGQKLKDGMMNLPSGKMLGGSTSINYMAYVRGDPGDFDAWAAGGAEGWTWKEVLPYFRKSESLISDAAPEAAVDKEAHGFGGPYSVSFRNPQRDDVSAFVRAAQEQGYKAADYNSSARAELDAAGRGVVSPHQFSIKANGRRESSYTAFLEPHMGKRPNLHVQEHARASRVLLDGQKAVGVEYVEEVGLGETKQVYARHEVVVSCGSYASAGLLLRSGLGPKDELADDGVDCQVNLPGVGKNLKDHLYICVPVAGLGISGGELLRGIGMHEDTSAFDEYLKTGRGLAATGLYEASAFYSSGLKPSNPSAQDGQISFCCCTSLPSLWSMNFGIKDFTEDNWNFEKMFHESQPSGMLLFTFNRPESSGEVRLAGKDVHVQHNYLTHEADAAMYVATCKEGIKFLDQPSLKGFSDLEVLIPKALSERFGTDLQSDALWQAWIRSYAQTIYHPVATCALNTVVDPECRVFQVDGLRVADASIMPDALSGNTQAACIMIGEKAADMIARQYGLHISS